MVQGAKLEKKERWVENQNLKHMALKGITRCNFPLTVCMFWGISKFVKNAFVWMEALSDLTN